MKIKSLLFTLGLAISISACGDKNKSEPMHTDAEITNEVLGKFFASLPKVSGQLDIKGVKIGMTLKDVLQVLQLKPTYCCSGGDESYVAQYLPDSREEERFPTTYLIEPGAPDSSPNKSVLDLSKIPDNASTIMKGRITLLDDSGEFQARFINGKLEFFQVTKINSGKDDASETHVLVDSFAKKFGEAPKLFKYQSVARLNECQRLAKLPSESDKQRAANCANSFSYIAGFRDSQNAILVIEGSRVVAPGFGDQHVLNNINLQSQGWFEQQVALGQQAASKQEAQQQEALKKRNSNL